MNGHNETNGHSNGDAAHALPSAKPFRVASDLVVQPPLSRRGHGPGLILLVPDGLDLSGSAKTLDPPPLQKWAEEGWAVAQITVPESASSALEGQLRAALEALTRVKECDSVEKVGVISYNLALTGEAAAAAFDAIDAIVGIVTYGTHTIASSKPTLQHLAGATAKTNGTNTAPNNTPTTLYTYPDAGAHFSIPASDDFRSATAAVAHTRSLTFLKPRTGGPYFDIEAVWEEHTQLEFEARDVEATMATMVQEPYVNHVTTLTGGLGRARLTDFYRHHFVFANPDDTTLELVSRTVGIDRVIDEFNFCLTHDRVVDWLLPGVPPTGKYVEIPFTSVVNIRGDRLYHEHIAWDQATVLRQLGLLPEYLPFPYALPDGRRPGAGKRFEYRVPATGVETASKLRDESAVESNGMFAFEVREVDGE